MSDGRLFICLSLLLPERVIVLIIDVCLCDRIEPCPPLISAIKHKGIQRACQMCVCPLPSKPTRHTKNTKNSWSYFWGHDKATQVLKLLTEIQTQAAVQRTTMNPAYPWTPRGSSRCLSLCTHLSPSPGEGRGALGTQGSWRQVPSLTCCYFCVLQQVSLSSLPSTQTWGPRSFRV